MPKPKKQKYYRCYVRVVFSNGKEWATWINCIPSDEANGAMKQAEATLRKTFPSARSVAATGNWGRDRKEEAYQEKYG